MGDIRFSHPLEAVRAATDRTDAIRRLSDEDVVQALAGASRAGDPYLSNVLGTEALNRISRKTAIVESAAQGLLTIERGPNTIRYANPAAERMTGMLSAALQGTRLVDLLRHDTEHPDPVATPEGLAAALERGRSDGIRRGLLRTGEARSIPVEWSLTPIAQKDDPGCVLTLTDVSARDSAEASLNEQWRLRTMLLDAQDDLQEGILVLDGDQVVHANRSLRTILGIPATEPLTLDHILARLEPRARASLREAIEHPRDKTAESVELEVRGTSGKARRIDARLTRGRLRDRESVVLVVRDVTLPAFLREAVRVSERDLRTTFTHADVPLALLDADGRWLRANESACARMGVALSDIQRYALERVFDPRDHEALRAVLSECRRDGTARVIARLAHGDRPGDALEVRLRWVDAEDEQGRYAVALLDAPLDASVMAA